MSHKAGVGVLRLKAGRERSLRRRHPWVFSGAIDAVTGPLVSGATVRVEAAEGAFLAWAAYSANSQIRARVWSFEQALYPDAALIAARISAALAHRRQWLDASCLAPEGAYRLVHGESDGLPGVIVDRYGKVLVMQLLSAGAEHWRAVLIQALLQQTGCSVLVERSDTDARQLEGLPPTSGLLHGELEGNLQIIEHGLHYEVDVLGGQKTGFYLDQRDNRQLVARLAAGRDVLNAFCYSGGFTLPALKTGARSVLSIDSSGPALASAQRNQALNGLSDAPAQWQEADVFQRLRSLRKEGRSFDLIVLDPPKFAPTSRDAERAARGYKDINLNAMKLLRPGGLLATFSCSSGISVELFRKIIAGAAADAAMPATVLANFCAAPDHPVALEFPEGEYLKGLFLKRN